MLKGALCKRIAILLQSALSLALAVHDVPEGLAISLVLVPHGVGPRRVVERVLQLPQPLMAVPVFSELVPDALEETSRNLVAVVITASVLVMVVFQVLIR